MEPEGRPNIGQLMGTSSRPIEALTHVSFPSPLPPTSLHPHRRGGSRPCHHDLMARELQRQTLAFGMVTLTLTLRSFSQ